MTPTPPLSEFTPRERRLIARLRTPRDVQACLNALPYNTEPGGATLRSFRRVVELGTAHCFEAAMFACVVLEQHGYPPLVLSFESIDGLDHVLFAYRHNGHWGSVARSRDPGLHGRKPVFATPRALASSYVDAYVDYTGGVKAYAIADMRNVEGCNWRFSPRNVWKAEQYLLDYPHHKIRPSRARIATLRARYVAFREAHDIKPVDYERRDRWMPIPKEFRRAEGLPFAGPLWRARTQGRAFARPPNRDRSRASGA